MEKITTKLIENKKSVIIIFVSLIIICGVLTTLVSVNNNIFDYLPKGVPSSKALEVLDEEFNTNIPNLRAMLRDVTIGEALDYKEKINGVEGVKEVIWLDDNEDLTEPIEVLDKDKVESFYKDGNALLTITIDETKSNVTISQIREIIGNENAIGGESALDQSREQTIKSELALIFAIALPIIFIILLLTTSSWFEPLLFLAAILTGVIINMGTNAFLGEISFVTQAAAGILQLAVSMDYAIFILHRFAQLREQGLNVQDAMVQAVTKSYKSVLSSGITTIAGFAALITMNFLIGTDMGIVMTKGIILSLISVLFFLPVLAVSTYKLIDKTHHKSFIPSLSKIGEYVVKLRIPIIIVFLLLLVPSYLAQKSNYFDYSGYNIKTYNTTEAMNENNEIVEKFGQSNLLILMVPRGNLADEAELCKKLENIPRVTSLISYSKTVGNEIPTQYLQKSKLSLLQSKNFSRIIITLNSNYEGEETFAIVDDIKALANEYYGDSYHLAGESASRSDLKDTVISDNKKVSIITMVSILVVLLLLFKSPVLPLILVLTIELAIWMNFGYIYFTGGLLSYVAYLILGAIQLGSTIDYAILFSSRYIENRVDLDKKGAVVKTVCDSGISIITSALILMTCGFILGRLSTFGIISQIGMLVGSGALLSTIMVIFVLPALLILFDKLIPKYKEDKLNEKNSI